MTDRAQRLQRLIGQLRRLRDRDLAHAETLLLSDRTLAARELDVLSASCDDALLHTFVLAAAARQSAHLARERAALSVARETASATARRHGRLFRAAENRLAQARLEQDRQAERRALERLGERPTGQSGASLDR